MAPASIGTPLRRLRLVDRAQLVTRLLDAVADRFVVVVAPAGYGKTTTVLLWDEADERDFVWVHLDEMDDDPVHLVRHVAAALAEVVPLPPTIERLLGGTGHSAELELVPALGAVLASSPPVVLVLDDIHAVRSVTALRCVEGLIGHVAPGSQVALVGRSVAALPLARRRLEHGVTELGVDDLAMDEREAAQLLGTSGVELGAEAVLNLVERTEGWPGGLHLAALALGPRRPLRSTLATVSGHDPLVAEYLLEEALGNLPERTVAFLLRSSVLDQMTAELLDDLLDRQDSEEVLDEIEQSGNAFLVRLDAERRWFRYHHLFRDLLRDRLRATAPSEMRRLQERASVLLERMGDDDRAVRHAVAAGDEERAADLILRRAAGLAFTGGVHQLERWLDRLGPGAMERLPAAAMASAWLAVATADAELFYRSTIAVEAAAWNGPLPDGSPSVAVAVGVVRAVVAPDGLAGVIVDTDIVLAGGGPTTNRWWGVAAAIQGTALSMLGDDVRARELLSSALPTLAGLPAFEAGTLAHLALLDLREGDLDEADRQIRLALDLAERHQLDVVVPVIPVYAVGALVLARQGLVVEASRSMSTCETMLVRLGYLSARTAVLCNLLLAQASLTSGDGSRAQQFAADAERARRREPSATYLNGQLDALHATLAEGRDGAPTLLDPLTPAELRVLAYLPTHLSLREVADLLDVSRHTIKSQTVAVYRKLGVSSRSDAVEAARGLGLLAG